MGVDLSSSNLHLLLRSDAFGFWIFYIRRCGVYLRNRSGLYSHMVQLSTMGGGVGC